MNQYNLQQNSARIKTKPFFQLRNASKYLMTASIREKANVLTQYAFQHYKHDKILKIAC